MKYVICGDLHIPTRRDKIKKEVLDAIRDEKPDKILCTGDLVESYVLGKLKEMGYEASRVHYSGIVFKTDADIKVVKDVFLALNT